MIVDTILERALAYPDREALLDPSGPAVLYRDVAKLLPANAGLALRTSGTTTGVRKLVTVSDDQLARKMARHVAMRGQEFAAARSMFSVVSTTVEAVGMHLLLLMLLRGGTMVMSPSQPIDAWRDLDFCQKRGIETFHFVPKLPMVWDYIAARHPYRFKYVFVSGAATSRDELRYIKDRVCQDHLWVHYAATEVGPIAGGSFKDVGTIEGCVGRVVPGVEVAIDGGQVCVRCDSMVARYENDEGMTRDRFKGGWFYPGDLGHFEGDLLCIDGRV